MARIGLALIARETGLSVSTVSLGLRNDSRLRLATRQKIQEVGRRLGYRPNPLLASLASRRFRGAGQVEGSRLAYLVSMRGEDENHRDGDKLMIREARNHARKLGYALESVDVNDFTDGAHLSRVLYARGVQGLLLSQFLKPESLAGLDWNPYSVVALGDRTGSATDLPRLHRASVDHFGLITRAWDEAWQLGYRRIGFVLFQHGPTFADDEARFGAVAACQARLPFSQRVPSLRWEAEEADLQSKLVSWVRANRPECVFGFNEWVLALLRMGGLRVPKDLGFATLHTRWGEGRDAISHVAGMVEMAPERVYAAVELLDQQIRHHRHGLDPQARTILIHSQWVGGETLPKRPAVAGLGDPTICRGLTRN